MENESAIIKFLEQQRSHKRPRLTIYEANLKCFFEVIFHSRHLSRKDQCNLRLTCKMAIKILPKEKVRLMRDLKRQKMMDKLGSHWNKYSPQRNLQLFNIIITQIRNLRPQQKDAFLFHYLPRMLKLGPKFRIAKKITEKNTDHWDLAPVQKGSPIPGRKQKYRGIYLRHNTHDFTLCDGNCYCCNQGSLLVFGAHGQAWMPRYRWNGTSVRETFARTFMIELRKTDDPNFKPTDDEFYEMIEPKKKITPDDPFIQKVFQDINKI